MTEEIVNKTSPTPSRVSKVTIWTHEKVSTLGSLSEWSFGLKKHTVRTVGSLSYSTLCLGI